MAGEARAERATMPGMPNTPDLPDYANEDSLTSMARAADLALLDEAIREVGGLGEALSRLRERVELRTTSRYLELAASDLTDTIPGWPTRAGSWTRHRRGLNRQNISPSRPNELQRQLWRR